MDNFNFLGEKLKQLRGNSGLGIKLLAPKLGVDYSYLSKLENGKERPSVELLNKMVDFYKLSLDEASELFLLAGYKGKEVTIAMNQNDVPIPENALRVNLPGNLPVLYTDAIAVNSNQFGFVLDFGQQAGPTKQVAIVARIGLSREHVQALIEKLTEHLRLREKAVRVVKESATN